MSPLPQIVSLPGKVVLRLGCPPNLRYTGLGEPETIMSSSIPSRLSSTLRRLKITLGPDVDAFDDYSLSLALTFTRDHCSLLESISITAHTSVWTLYRQNLIQRWISSSLLLYKRRIVDPQNNSEVVATTRRSLSESTTSTIRFPFDRINEDSIRNTLRALPQLRELVLLPISSQTHPSQDVDARLAASVRSLTHLRDLRKISLPLDLLSDLRPLFYVLSALPTFHALELLPPSSYTFAFPAMLEISSAIIIGLHDFHHLRRISLPSEFISDPVRDCLGGIHELRELKITTTSRSISSTLLTPRQGQFSKLKTLEVTGSLSDLFNAIRAVAPRGTSVLKRIYVEAEMLQNGREMRNMLSAISRRCPRIKELGIQIKGLHREETKDWVDLQQLHNCANLEEFVIRHPRPLALTDDQLCSLLRAWPLATHISINPRPSLPPWSMVDLPTLACLPNLVRTNPSVRHFGAHLNSRAPHNLNHAQPTLHILQELDLGTPSTRERQTISRLATRLFPAARLVL